MCGRPTTCGWNEGSVDADGTICGEPGGDSLGVDVEDDSGVAGRVLQPATTQATSISKIRGRLPLLAAIGGVTCMP